MTTARQGRRSPAHRSGRSGRVERGIGCGVDVVELERFRASVRRGGARFLQRIFTEAELAYSRARKRTTLLHLAGRFAAKEAVLKALWQLNPRATLTMKQVEVCNDRLGRPRAVLHGRASGVAVHISLSHVKTVAVASAIAVQGSPL